VIVWPKRAEIDAATRRWAADVAPTHPELRRLGYFGSYARGNWGVGSDLDLVAIVAASERSFAERAAAWPTEALPVPVDLMVYTEAEWEALADEQPTFWMRLNRETVWVWPFEEGSASTSS
jgi:predicted nucleotidyltransferase